MTQYQYRFGILCLFLFVITLFVIGCNDRIIEDKNDHYDVIYSVKVIDGCQYILRDRGIAHKGNCTNSIHIYTKPLAEAK